MAADRRPVRDPRQRGHAPADPGRPGRAAVPGDGSSDGPTAAALAAASRAEVLAAWVGLGYNRRALALHAAARGGRPRRLAGRPAHAAGRRPVHGGRGRLVRVRRAGGGGRHERAARRRAPRARHAGGARPARPRGRLEPGRDGARRDRLHGARCRDAPSARSRRGARRPVVRRAGGERPARRGRALRGLQPLGPRRVVAALAEGRGCRRTSPRSVSSGRSRAWSATASCAGWTAASR